MNWRKNEYGEWNHAPWWKVAINTVLRRLQCGRQYNWLVYTKSNGEPVALGYRFGRIRMRTDHGIKRSGSVGALNPTTPNPCEGTMPNERNTKPRHACNVDSCDKPLIARGMCSKHWHRWRRRGSNPDEAPKQSRAERFWGHVDKAGPLKPRMSTSCWVWTGSTSRGGYGHFGKGGHGQTVLAHRIAYEMAKGPIAAGLEIDHKCYTAACVNPEHLQALTPKEHRRLTDAQRVPRTHCRRGHPYEGEGSHAIARPNGHRECMHCACIAKLAREARG